MSEIQIPDNARAVLVSIGHDGLQRMQPVAGDESVLNIERDLINHLSALPCSEAFLRELQSYVAARLEARSADRVASDATRTHRPHRTFDCTDTVHPDGESCLLIDGTATPRSMISSAMVRINRVKNIAEAMSEHSDDVRACNLMSTLAALLWEANDLLDIAHEEVRP